MEKIKVDVRGIEEKKLPSNIEAEQALIGSVLVNNDIIDEISSIVSANKFFDPAHRKIFEVIENLNNKGMIANPITLKNYFENNSGLEEVGGIDYLVKLTINLMHKRFNKKNIYLNAIKITIAFSMYFSLIYLFIIFYYKNYPSISYLFMNYLLTIFIFPIISIIFNWILNKNKSKVI